MRWVWIAVGTVVGMACAAILADLVYPGDWREAEATVLATDIQRTRPGTPQWSIMADVAYEVAGRRYERKGLEVFRNEDREVSIAEQQDWPEGRALTVYYSVSDPREISRWPDGGRQAVIVVAALAVPIMAALGFFILALARAYRRSRADSGEL